ncbi:Serine/threonine protein kinase SRPK1 [Heracleum sosnowskyi]|uniref:Serine/threonine protein kinase SRPK1 n=1 Tax=Heracleum sosnowskyi TaxID=360622 RepID=A0AAD8IWS4_9APIA|nr:Serine/threonine protein kinase SRPK1 [Heracleum sosnowskyi]
MDDSMKDELLTEEIKVLSEKVSKLSEENDYLRNEIEMKDACLTTLKQQTSTESKKADTEQQFFDLQNKIELLKKDLSKFVHGEGTLDALLAEQKSSLDKEGLGYSSVRKSVFQRGSKRTICLKAHIPRNKWIIESGCSRHMTGDKSKFLSIDARDGGLVTLGDSTTVRIIGKGTIGNDKFSINNVRLVDGLKYNLISVSQLTDAGHDVKFGKDMCLISTNSNHTPLIAKRQGNIFVLDFDEQKEEICLASIQDQQKLWHRRLGHVHMDLINKISSHSLVRGLPRLKYKKTEPCTSCQMGKQVRTSFKIKKQISTTVPLQMLHLDLFGPESYVSLGGKRYAFVIVDDFSRFTWVLFLKTKDEAFVEFQDLIMMIV